MKKIDIKYIFTAGGLLFGVLIAHPYIMLVYYFTSPGVTGAAGAGSNSTLGAARILTDAFSPDMLPMTIGFSFFCGVIGFLVGILIERNRKLQRMKADARQHEAVMNAARKLLSVLSHFVINSTIVIASETRRLRRLSKEEGVPGGVEKGLRAIELQAQRNEEVLKLMREGEYLQCLEGRDGSITKILELTRWLEERVAGYPDDPGSGKQGK